MNMSYLVSCSSENCKEVAKFLCRSCNNKVLWPQCKGQEKQCCEIDDYRIPTDLIKGVLDTYLKVTKISELSKNLEGLNREALDELQNYCEEAEDLAKITILIVEEFKHTEYNRVRDIERRLNAKFTRSQAFQELVDKLIANYVRDTQQNVLLSFRDRIFQNEWTLRNWRILDEMCFDLHQTFEAEIHNQLKHPFLITKMIQKDKKLYNSFQKRINKIIEENERWRNSFDTKTSEEVIFVKKNYNIWKVQFEKDEKKQARENLKSANRQIAMELKREKINVKRLSEALKVSQELEQTYKNKLKILSESHEDLSNKYNVLIKEHNKDLER